MLKLLCDEVKMKFFEIGAEVLVPKFDYLDHVAIDGNVPFGHRLIHIIVSWPILIHRLLHIICNILE